MVDIEPTKIMEYLGLIDISAESRIVIVVDPDTLTGGTVLYDKDVPSSKVLNGGITISGDLTDE